MVKNPANPKRKSILDSPEMAQAQNLMDKLNTARRDLSELIDKVQAETGMSIEEVRAIFENPANFTPEQWEIYQAKKNELFSVIDSLKSGLSPKRQQMLEDIKNPPSKGSKSKSKRRRLVNQKWILVK